MIIEGTFNDNGLRAEYEARFRTIEKYQKNLRIDFKKRKGVIDFTGWIMCFEALDLSELDLALLVTSGQLDFGGTCQKVGDTFSGVINLE